MTTLDGVERPLQESDIVIADARGPIALAGVMGGATSEVSAATTAVLLEAATFDPRSVRRTAKRLGLHSEASHRFERGVDANGIPHAGLRAAAMMARLGGGALAGEVIDRYPLPPQPRKVTLSMAGLRRSRGRDPAGAGGREAGVDRHRRRDDRRRPDRDRPQLSSRHLRIEPDLIEEVMRLVGYDRVPARLPPGRARPPPAPRRWPIARATCWRRTACTRW